MTAALSANKKSRRCHEVCGKKTPNSRIQPCVKGSEMIPWEYSHPQAGSSATWMGEPLPKPATGAEAALPARVWRRRAMPPAAVKTCSAALEKDFPQVRTWSWGPDDGFPQAARVSGALEMRFPRGATWSWVPDEDFPQAMTGTGALEIEFPGGTTSSAGLKNAFLGAAACPDRPQGRFFSSLDEPQPLTR